MKTEIIEFAAKFIKLVRDDAISICLSELDGNSISRRSKRWKKALETGDINLIGTELIPDIVDESLACLLSTIDNNLINLKYISDANTEIDLFKDGLSEMTGFYMGSSDGWRQQFSTQRINDDYPDLNLDFLND